MDIKVNDDNITITIGKDEVTSTYIGVGKEYSYADLNAKMGDNEYLRINYEWSKDSDFPDFVVGLMEFIRKNAEKSGANSKGPWEGRQEDYALCVKASMDRGL